MTEILLNALTDELTRGRDLIRGLDDVAYRHESACTGTIGGQFRHNLDMALCLLTGFATGSIDYAKRQRDERVETDRRYAIGRFDEVVESLNEVDVPGLSEWITVRSEIDPERWFQTETCREIEFVHSHSVHHHALIAERLEGLGLEVPRNFGVASSTIAYWRRAA